MDHKPSQMYHQNLFIYVAAYSLYTFMSCPFGLKISAICFLFKCGCQQACIGLRVQTLNRNGWNLWRPPIKLLSLIVGATNSVRSGVWALWLGSLVQIIAAWKQVLGTHLYRKKCNIIVCNKGGCNQICIILIPKTVEVAGNGKKMFS